MEFWEFRDPTVKRGKETTVRMRSSFPLGGREVGNKTAQGCNAENMCRQPKKKKKFREDRILSVLCYEIHFAELAITAGAPASVDDPYKTPKPELCYTAVSICQPVF